MPAGRDTAPPATVPAGVVEVPVRSVSVPALSRRSCSSRAKRSPACIGPTVWELDGPTPIRKSSKTLTVTVGHLIIWCQSTENSAIRSHSVLPSMWSLMICGVSERTVGNSSQAALKWSDCTWATSAPSL